MKKLPSKVFLGAGLISAIMSVPAMAQSSSPQATPPYQLSVFANAPTGLSAPDSLAVLGNYVFVGYGDGHAPDGSDGLNSQVVQYRMDGSVVYTYTVPGHNDGLKIDPSTHLLWAIQNEDSNPNLVIINPQSHKQSEFTFGPTLHGGGYDDVVFRGCKVYLSASNPLNNPNTGPAIVSAVLEGTHVNVEPVLAGEAQAIDIPTDASVTLNLQDPDSMTLDPLGNIVLDSQADQQLILIGSPGSPGQRVLRLPLSYQSPTGVAPVEVDDTAFTTSTEGFVLIADKGLNQVFELRRQAFAPGVAFTAADGAKLVGTIDLTSGFITPVVTGLSNPGGLVFVDTTRQASEASPVVVPPSCENHGGY
jgi:hypothetical protein